MYKKSGTQQGIPAARTWLCLLNNMAANKTGSQLLRRTGPGNRGGRRKGKTLIGVNVWSATSATCSSINTLSALYLCSFSFFFYSFPPWRSCRKRPRVPTPQHRRRAAGAAANEWTQPSTTVPTLKGLNDFCEMDRLPSRHSAAGSGNITTRPAPSPRKKSKICRWILRAP